MVDASDSPPRTLRAVVLARGLGTRMRAADAVDALDPVQRAAADAGLKGMIPVGGGRPFLDHVLHSVAETGIRNVALVLGPEHEQVRAYYGSRATRRIAISFVMQPRPLGTADAVACVEPWTRGEPFLVLNADNLYPLDVLRRLAASAGPALPGFAADSLELPLPRLGTFALVERDARGCLARIVEKPGEAAVAAAGETAMISMNVWHFDERIFAACRSVPLSSRGERELPQAVGLAAASGLCFDVFPARGPVLDLSQRSDVARIARRLEHAAVVL